MSDKIIYIIDDNASVCHALNFLFNSFLNYKVRVFEDPLLFLEVCSIKTQGCLIIDRDMPGLSGIELMKRVKKINAQIPMIIMSGDITGDAEAQALEAGADAFIKKPFKTEQLLATITTMMSTVQEKTCSNI
jgi:FixJ family two-component response regulator